MPKNVPHVPKHRGVPDHSALKSGARSTLLYSGVAAVATGVSVSSGVLATGGPGATAALASSKTTLVKPVPAPVDRTPAVSRSSDDRRAQADALKQDALRADTGVARTSTQKINAADPRALAKALMPEFGLRTSEFGCLDRIWTQESGWNVHADNPSSSAYGIPQALPGSKMSSAGADWANSAETQIRWGLGYIRDRYGSACSAWGFKAGHGWY